MTINLITFASMLHKQETVRHAHQAILNELEKHFTINLVDYTQIDSLPKDEFSILFIATGGVERLVMQAFESLPRPTLLLADGMQNSLAASLEISSWLRSRGLKSEILHGEADTIVQRIKVLYVNFKAQQALKGVRIGVIGPPSSWLIASNVDYLLAKRRWGIQYTDISIERIQENYDRITDEEVDNACADFASRAFASKEATPEDLIKAMRLYRALKQVCEEEQLTAVTVSCFRLMDHTHTTGCLAISLLNDDGIPAGCEGDLQSIFTLLAVKTLTGKNGFMANPSMLDTRTNEMVLAHCTIGTRQVDAFIIRNHFESESGIGIQGILPTGEVTVVKCGGECLDEYYLTTGTLTENTNYTNVCRTQVRVRLNSPVDYFLKNPLGNHHIIVPGGYEEALNNFLAANGCKRIE